MELLFSTCYIQVISTRQFLRQMSPSTYVCKYSGTRYALIHVPNYASSVCITIILLMTHVCHVLYCNMLLCIVCYCMYVIGYLCGDSYSVPLHTPLTLYISDMATHDSSGGEDSARFHFTSWCLLCGHVVRSKRHVVKHFAYCPKPHRCDVDVAATILIGQHMSRM